MAHRTYCTQRKLGLAFSDQNVTAFALGGWVHMAASGQASGPTSAAASSGTLLHFRLGLAHSGAPTRRPRAPRRGGGRGGRAAPSHAARWEGNTVRPIARAKTKKSRATKTYIRCQKTILRALPCVPSCSELFRAEHAGTTAAAPKSSAPRAQHAERRARHAAQPRRVRRRGGGPPQARCLLGSAGLQ